MEQEKIPQGYNLTFGILSALAIIMIVAGHADCAVLTIGGLFPYYSFHVPLFMFISGYFYKDESESDPGKYVIKKVKRLLIPYFVWNLIYGILAQVLKLQGFNMGENLSLYNLFIAPFMHGYQFVYNYAAWFVPVLFLIEMMNLLCRLVLGAAGRKIRIIQKYKDEIIFILALIAGVGTVMLSIGGHVWGNYRMPGRLLFLFPAFEMGRIYKKLEANYIPRLTGKTKELCFIGAVLIVVILIQTVIVKKCGALSFSAVWCTGFGNGPVIPYLTIVTGISFWLCVSRLISMIPIKHVFFRYLGTHTYQVMMHHPICFMLLKAVIAACAYAGVDAKLLTGFDFEQFYNNADYYFYVGSHAFSIVYVIVGIAIPLAATYVCERFFAVIKCSRKQ